MQTLVQFSAAGLLYMTKYSSNKIRNLLTYLLRDKEVLSSENEFLHWDFLWFPSVHPHNWQRNISKWTNKIQINYPLAIPSSLNAT